MNESVKELKIVIVEDNMALADIYKTRLELVGYRCFTAYDGIKALEVIEHERPDLVLLDMMVPEIAGDQILKRMRDSDWGKDIRVFVISNLDEVDAPRGLRDLGIEGYVVKANISNDELDKLVDNILKPQGQTEDTTLEAAPGEYSATHPRPVQQAEFSIEHSDKPADQQDHRPNQDSTQPEQHQD